MPGDVGAVATLLNTVLGWALDPEGYAQLTRENKLKELHNATLAALEANQWDAVDRILAEYKRLSTSST